MEKQEKIQIDKEDFDLIIKNTIPTEEENLINMKRCPRWENGSIPRCPLDYWMKERKELPEDEKCILIGKYRGKRTKGNISSQMRDIKRFIWEKNQK